MENTLSKLMWFIGGAACGGLVAWIATKRVYEKYTQAEIDSVKDAYRRAYEEDKPEEESAEEPVRDFSVPVKPKKFGAEAREAAVIASDEGYIDPDAPVIIHPNEYGEYHDYGEKSLLYFSDGVLTDEDYEEVEDVDDIIGYDALDHIGDYEDDAVHVRNDRLKCYYEVLLDMRKYHVDIRPPEEGK